MWYVLLDSCCLLLSLIEEGFELNIMITPRKATMATPNAAKCLCKAIYERPCFFPRGEVAVVVVVESIELVAAYCRYLEIFFFKASICFPKPRF